MKTLFCFLLLSHIFFESVATDYYSRGSVEPNMLANWDEDPGGGTLAPLSFTNPGDRFIIQNGHTMITTASWTVGGAGSILQIQSGGILRGDHAIYLSGSFQIDDNGSYIHNNTASVSETTGSSIFSGTEVFAAGSHFEIRNWPGKNVGLPNTSPGISWGNLVVNLQSDLASDGLPWNWSIADSSTLTIKGNLDIRATYVDFPTELLLTPSGIQIISIGGNFLMSGFETEVSLKGTSSPHLDGYTTTQVHGNIVLTGGSQLELGVNTSYPGPFGLYELRFKGNFISNSAAGVLYSSSKSASLVANGTSPQTFSHLWHLGTNLRVAPGATLNLASALTLYGTDQMLAISGTLNQNGYKLTVNGTIEVAGGIFNSSGIVSIGRACTSCSNLNGIYNDADNTWCTTTGGKGRINFTGSTISLNKFDSVSVLAAGHSFVSSPGDIYFVNSTATAISDEPPVAKYYVNENSVLSLDGNSYIAGEEAMYLGRGGTLRIGSAEGITMAGNTTTGNVRTGLNKEYNLSGLNSFEYFGVSPQVTGSGLPAAIEGMLKINNSAGPGTTGVTLSQLTTVSGTLELVSGKLTTSLPNLIVLDNSALVNLPVWGGSFVAGPMKKIGNSSFSFPIGKGNNFAPLAITGNGEVTDEYIAEYFMGNPGVMIGSNFENPPIDRISELEWWTIDRSAGASDKKVSLEATTYSDAILLSDLRIVAWDGSIWKDNGNTAYVGVSSGQVTGEVVNDFFAAGTGTAFTFGTVTAGANVLPINLISFDAAKISSSRSVIAWELAVCCSAAVQFEVQRAGANRNFNTIGRIAGSETNRLYNYNDNSLQTGINYYRLKMIDADGTITYSRTVAIMNGVKGLLLTSLIPTLITNTSTVTIASSGSLSVDLVIVDMQGRVIQKQNHAIVAGNTTIQLTLGGLAAGLYQLTGISAAGKTNTIQFIKQ